MPITIQEARSQLVDALTDIKNKQFDLNHEAPPAKRRCPNQTASRPPQPQVDVIVRNRNPTFILKLFDRSIDLFPYSKDDNMLLYPTCRAWVLNQRHKPTLLIKQEHGSQNHDCSNTDSCEQSQQSDQEQEEDDKAPLNDKNSETIVDVRLLRKNFTKNNKELSSKHN